MHSPPDAIVLCGGAGVRLRSVTGAAPKSMADVAGRPFLELLVNQLRRQGFSRVVLAVGYRQEVIRAHFDGLGYGVDLVFSAEPSPMGTGGALRYAADLVQSAAALVMNGDSYTDVDLGAFVRSYYESGKDVSVVVVPADQRRDCGSVAVDSGGRVVRFEEKQDSGAARYVNAGIYLMSRGVLYGIPVNAPVSLEHELFPRWLAQGKEITAFLHPGTCMDIGTPERYRAARHMLADAEPANAFRNEEQP